MNIETIQSVYFVGAGGIGMSALVRYFLSKGKVVAGYDRTPSELTQHLIEEGAQIHYEENIDLIPEACKDKATTLGDGTRIKGLFSRQNSEIDPAPAREITRSAAA